MSEYLERKGFEFSLKHPWFFRQVARRFLYHKFKDPEEVHAAALSYLSKYYDVLVKNADLFDFPELEVDIKGHKIKPFGTAAGMDKDGRCFEPFSHVYGFQESGTVVLRERAGNPKPRVAVGRLNLYNSQGFPSKGLDFFLERIMRYRSFGGDAVIYASVCGLPIDDNVDKAIYHAVGEFEQLLEALNPYVDGFVWNPFSPNTEALQKLRSPELFAQHAVIMGHYAKDKLKLVKMGPYSGPDWLKLVDSWLSEGGDGIVAVNTRMVPKEEVPSWKWGYPSAGVSGQALQNNRLMAVEITRQTFPKAIIFATGGIFSAQDAYRTFEAGATALESYTPETFYGFGLVRKKMKGVLKLLKRNGLKNLEELVS